MDAVSDIKQKLSVDEVIGDYLELKRSGRNFKALSPFTNEKTASFVVSPDKQIWQCFSSNKGGDMFTFVQEVEGVDFRGALEILARRAGLDLADYDQKIDKDLAKLKSSIYEMHEIAARMYQKQLVSEKTALEYLKSRQFNRQSVLDFSLGYAPAGGKFLVDILRRKGFRDQDIIKAGLAVRKGPDVLDMFRGRLMIALADGQGRIIGFTARTLRKDGVPKYLNTPQTPLYDKSRHLFGLHLAKDAIRQDDSGVIVEGNLDVVSSHQAGVKNVVASAGTALTLDQVKQLSRLTKNVYLAYDQDNAGLKASIRAIEVAQSADIKIDIITLPEGKDPDDLIKKDPKQWQAAIENHVHVVDWLIDYHRKRLDIKTARGKTELANQLVPVIAKLNDPVEQDHFLKEVASHIDSSLLTLQKKLAQKLTAKKKLRKFEVEVAEPDKHQLQEDRFLCLVLAFPESRVALKELSGIKLSSE